MEVVYGIYAILWLCTMFWTSTGTKGIDKLPDCLLKVSVPGGWNPLQGMLFLFIMSPYIYLCIYVWLKT